GKLKWQKGPSCIERPGQHIPQRCGLFELLRGGHKDIFIDEALPRERTAQLKQRIVLADSRQSRTRCQISETPAHGCKIALEIKVTHRSAFQYAAEQRIAGYRRKLGRV